MDKFYTVKEVAKMLKIGDEAVREHLRKKKLNGVKVGRYWRITKKDINDFIKK